MGWVNLNTLYVPKSGGTMTGSLTVPANQTLTCYNGTTSYNVGATLKSLQDSISSNISALKTGSIYLKDYYDIKYMCHNHIGIATITLAPAELVKNTSYASHAIGSMATNGTIPNSAKLPSGYRPTQVWQTAGVSSSTVTNIRLYANTDGSFCYQLVGGANLTSSCQVYGGVVWHY